jgi:2-dehydropantoate 2-reductase
MRQVPKNLNYLFIGNGRLATHLNYYLKNCIGLTPKSNSLARLNTWNRQDNSLEDLKNLLTEDTIVLLCIPDREINSFCQELQFTKAQFVHFSGTLQSEFALGFHPLMTFGFNLFPLERYNQIAFVGTTTSNTFNELFPSLKNPYFQISKEHKNLYHSLCVLSGNGTTLLWELIREKMNTIDLPSEILNPYMEQVFFNLINKDLGRMTGPWYRKDNETIERNLKSLESTNLMPLYKEFLNLALLRSPH